IKASDGSYKASELKSVINKGHWIYTVATTGDHPMADGEYTFTVQAFDAEKNESSSSVKSVTLYIDNIPSKVTISYPLLRSSVSAWDNTAEIYLPEHTDYYLNDTFYIQGSISEDFAVDNLYIRLTEVTYNNEETPNYLDVTIDSEINITSGGTIKDNTLSIIKEKKDTVSIWSWKIRLQEKITGADILTPKYYKISTKVTDAAGNSDQHNHGYICVLPQSDYPYCLFNDYGDKIPVNTPLTGKACDDDGIAAVTIQLCDRFGNEIPGKTDILPKDMQIMNDGTYTPSNAAALGKFYNWKTENSIPNIGGEYILRVMITDINGRSSWSYYGDNQYIHNNIYRQKDLLMMDLSAPSIDIQGLKGKVTVVNTNDKPLDFDEYTDIVDASGDFTLVCNASDASQITKIYLAQLLPGVTEAEQNALTAIDPETSNIKWHIDWDEQDSVVIGHIRYFRLYEYNGDEIQAKLTKYQPLNIYTDFSNTYEKKIFYVYAENASEKTTVSYRAIAIEPDKPEIKLIAPNAGATLTNVFSIRAEVTDFTGLQDLTLSAYQKWQSDHEKLLTFSELQNDASFAADASGHFQKVTINDLPSSLFGETFIGGVCTLTMTAKDLYGNTVSEKVQFHIDTDEPVIKNISAKPAVGTYKAGDTIRLQMEISKEVSISGGTPTLTLALDNGVTATADLSNDPSDGTAAPNILPFQYTVAAGQNTQLLNCIGLNLNGAVIQDAQHYAVDPANLPTD
ncbi:MAG: hypothetical protein IKP67_09070, partial [Spirochaetales bacterium]|nr:hypothetical protein [Spirochaetales bacterium]